MYCIYLTSGIQEKYRFSSSKMCICAIYHNIWRQMSQIASFNVYQRLYGWYLVTLYPSRDYTHFIKFLLYLHHVFNHWYCIYIPMCRSQMNYVRSKNYWTYICFISLWILLKDKLSHTNYTPFTLHLHSEIFRNGMLLLGVST